MKQLLRGLWAGLLVGVVGCTQIGPAPPLDERPPAAAVPESSIKTLTIAQLNAVKGYGPWDFANTSGGGPTLAEVHTNGLVTGGAGGSLEPRVAAKLPSFDDGSIVQFPDGRMETTWKLRPGVVWHDGTPFTSADVAFSFEVQRDPDLRSGLATPSPFIERIITPDPATVVITWRSTYFKALELGHRALWLFPQHLLSDAFQGDKRAFLNLPYFTSEYVQLGPFRLVDYGLGETQVFSRFDAYYLGRPRIDTIIFKTIADPNTVLANLRAKAIDIAPELTLSTDVYGDLRNEWQQSGGGALLVRQDQWRYLWFQFDTRWAHPVEMSQDVRIRRGLAYGFDRQELQRALFPGFEKAGADTFMDASDARAQVVGAPFGRYPYDPERAARELADGGWRRAADGRLLSQAGEQVQIEVRGSSPRDATDVAIVADYWRRLGIDVVEHIPSVAARTPEFRSTFPGLEVIARGSGDRIFDPFDSRQQSVPENSWVGANTAHYANPDLDRLVDQLRITVVERQQALLLKDMGEIMATQLPALPTYFRISAMAVTTTVQPLMEDLPATFLTGSQARNAHLWQVP